ncbi:hypothetical protein [Photobacterium aquae]|uniref:hypothetical protein n=1 Tax=Photobacterium aquae TaxID=1195763 RepID=UPI0012EDB83C|nr:hypothetical protein [Photobacterium aquae]
MDKRLIFTDANTPDRARQDICPSKDKNQSICRFIPRLNIRLLLSSAAKIFSVASQRIGPANKTTANHHHFLAMEEPDSRYPMRTASFAHRNTRSPSRLRTTSHAMRFKPRTETSADVLPLDAPLAEQPATRNERDNAA